MSKATSAGRTKAIDTKFSGAGTPGVAAGPVSTVPAPVVKGGGYTSYPDDNGPANLKGMVEFLRPKPFAGAPGTVVNKPTGNLKTGSGVAMPKDQVGAQQISGPGIYAGRSYKK